MPPTEPFLLTQNGELKHFIANCFEQEDGSILFLKSAKYLINHEQFLIAFKLCFSKNFYLTDRWLNHRHYST